MVKKDFLMQKLMNSKIKTKILIIKFENYLIK